MSLHFACVPLSFVKSSEGWKEAMPPFERVMATVGWMVFPVFRCVCGKRELSFDWSLAVVFPVTDAPALVSCHCRYGAASPAS